MAVLFLGVCTVRAKDDPDAVKITWRDGFRIASGDGEFELQVGGEIMNDWAFFFWDDDVNEALPADGQLADGTEFRRVRISLRGLIHGNVEYRFQYGFAGGAVAPKDVYLGFRRIPGLGTVRIGHQKIPFGRLDGSPKNYTFMESASLSALSPLRDMGIRSQASGRDDRFSWSLGVFKDTDRGGVGVGDGGYDAYARVTHIPWYAEKGRKLLHLGVGLGYLDPSDNELRIRQRPEAHLAPYLVDTGDVSAAAVHLLNLEPVLVHGPLSLQGEYVLASVNGGSDPELSGYYVMASWFFTGESRAYSKRTGSFGRLRPLRNFQDGGRGAWEIAARSSHLDLDDAEVSGGTLDDFTLGLNWYMNPSTKLMTNFIRADVEDVGKSHNIQFRFQVDY